MWFTSRVEATSMGTGLYIITWESKHNSVETSYAARDLLGNSAHSLEPFSLRSLLFLYIVFLQYTLPLSLSVNPCGLLHTCFYEPAAGYSKILQTEYITRA